MGGWVEKDRPQNIESKSKTTSRLRCRRVGGWVGGKELLQVLCLGVSSSSFLPDDILLPVVVLASSSSFSLSRHLAAAPPPPHALPLWVGGWVVGGVVV